MISCNVDVYYAPPTWTKQERRSLYLQLKSTRRERVSDQPLFIRLQSAKILSFESIANSIIGVTARRIGIPCNI